MRSLGEKNVNTLREYARNAGHTVDHLILHQNDYKELCKNLLTHNEPKLIVFSIPHGAVGD
jgi:hypothetical protein